MLEDAGDHGTFVAVVFQKNLDNVRDTKIAIVDTLLTLLFFLFCEVFVQVLIKILAIFDKIFLFIFKLGDNIHKESVVPLYLLIIEKMHVPLEQFFDGIEHLLGNLILVSIDNIDNLTTIH